jgi:hypothetical protein
VWDNNKEPLIVDAKMKTRPEDPSETTYHTYPADIQKCEREVPTVTNSKWVRKIAVVYM